MTSAPCTPRNLTACILGVLWDTSLLVAAPPHCVDSADFRLDELSDEPSFRFVPGMQALKQELEVKEVKDAELQKLQAELDGIRLSQVSAREQAATAVDKLRSELADAKAARGKSRKAKGFGGPTGVALNLPACRCSFAFVVDAAFTVSACFLWHIPM